MAANQLQGLDGVLDALKALPREVAGKNGGPVRVALAKGAKRIRDRARQLAAVDTGAVRDNIVLKRDRSPQRSGANERYLVGVRGGSQTSYADTKRNRRKGLVGQKYEKAGRTYYWRFLEFGTANAPPRPFLRPAFEQEAQGVLDNIGDDLRKAIASAAKRHAKTVG